MAQVRSRITKLLGIALRHFCRARVERVHAEWQQLETAAAVSSKAAAMLERIRSVFDPAYIVWMPTRRNRGVRLCAHVCAHTCARSSGVRGHDGAMLALPAWRMYHAATCKYFDAPCDSARRQALVAK